MKRALACPTNQHFPVGHAGALPTWMLVRQITLLPYLHSTHPCVLGVSRSGSFAQPTFSNYQSKIGGILTFPLFIFINPPQTQVVPDNDRNHHCQPTPVINKKNLTYPCWFCKKQAPGETIYRKYYTAPYKD